MKKDESQRAGIARIAFNTTGEKAFLVDYQTNDITLGDYFSEYVDEKADSLFSLSEIIELCPEYKNCLILVTYKVDSYSSFDGETTEWETVVTVKEAILLEKDYKQTFQKNIHAMYGFQSIEDTLSLGLEEVEKWESLYDEEYSYPKEEVKRVSILNLFL